MPNLRDLIVSLAMLFCLFAGSASAWADGCAPVDLSAAGQPFHDYPVSVQSFDSRSCFAFAASELADYWRLSHPRVKSPLGPAFVTSGQKLYDDMVDGGKASADGGWPGDALEFIRTHLVCDQMTLYGSHSRIDAHSLMHSYGEIYERSVADSRDCADEMIALYGQIQARHPDWMPDRIGLQGMYEFNLRRGWAHLLYTDIEPIGGFLPSGTYDTLGYLAALLARPSSAEFLAAYKEAACKNASAQSVIPKAFAEKTNDDHRIETLVNAALDVPNPQPSAIAICASVLGAAHPYAGRLSGFAAFSQFGCVAATGPGIDNTNSAQEHAVVVIGRRRNPKTLACEWLVRNTGGQQCAAMKYSGIPWDCQGVSDLWVDETELAHNTFEVTQLP